MKTKTLPLKEMSISEIYNGDTATYEVPIYQRNYAWEKDEISALIQDVYDAFTAKKQTYYIGTLVSFHKGDQVYEVIDGQQRLTTINLVLGALGIPLQNKLTYRARKKSNDTIQNLPDFQIDEKDYGIVNGYKYAEDAIDEVVPKACQDGFKIYFQNSVHLIHYQVPKDIDLNHYFEIMNSRGEQLEKHEIIKARLLQKLNNADKAKFNRLWEYCSEMNVYIQQKYSSDRKSAEQIFGKSLGDFGYVMDFDALPGVEDKTNTLKISELINYKGLDNWQEEEDKIDTFQPIMDYSNFLLIVLKLTRMEESEFDPVSFNLDDKELIHEFDKVKVDTGFVKRFGFNLLMAKYLLDNYIVHHSNEDDTIENNPWKLQYWQKEGKKGYLKNLDGESDIQHKLVQLLSMFEVSFTARQRKNYLFYCLLYLFHSEDWDIGKYYEFLLGLADKYIKDVYLVADNLNEINTPKPGSFDSTILCKNELDITPHNDSFDFAAIYGDGTIMSKGIPLFVFNYLDYKLWEKYANEFRGKKTKEGSKERTEFFTVLGCADFGLKAFEQFYFSRTRRSLEHYYPQANANGESGAPNEDQINCLGNYAMIGSETNSSGSNWSPKTKLDHYLDASGKIKLVSVASIKFMIMMQKCKDNQKVRAAGQEWEFEDIEAHQERMLELMLGEENKSIAI
ncbi:GmrSD restriction endonuclease domain-containing protein [Paenibacillus marinisediminis]